MSVYQQTIKNHENYPACKELNRVMFLRYIPTVIDFGFNFYIFLQKHANPNIRNLHEESPLDLAAQYGRKEVVQLLLIKFPDLVHRPLYNCSPLHLASRNGHRDIVDVLLFNGFNIHTLVSIMFSSRF